MQDLYTPPAAHNPQEYSYNVGYLERVNPFDMGEVPTDDGVKDPVDRMSKDSMSYPHLSDVPKALTGYDLPLPLAAFKLLVACVMFAAAACLTSELRRIGSSDGLLQAVDWSAARMAAWHG